MARAKDIEKQLRSEIDKELSRLTAIKVNCVLKTLAKLAEPLTEYNPNTEASKLTQRGKDRSRRSNVRGGAVGSPIYTGQYALNHYISINGVHPDPIVFGRAGERERALNPVNLTPEELVERESERIPSTLKFTDEISIVNETLYAEEIELHGTPRVPDGGFFAKAQEYLQTLLERELGSNIASANLINVSGFLGSER